VKISLIAAMAKNRVIGKNNQMPWHLPNDLKHFKAVTLGKPVVMGRKTYESIGRALPGRKNIVISTRSDFSLPDAEVVRSCEDALAAAEREGEEVMIIGGGKIYTEFMTKADVLYLTFIDLAVEGDTQFPDWQSYGKWKTLDTQSHHADDKNKYAHEFVTLARC